MKMVRGLIKKNLLVEYNFESVPIGIPVPVPVGVELYVKRFLMTFSNYNPFAMFCTYIAGRDILFLAVFGLTSCWFSIFYKWSFAAAKESDYRILIAYVNKHQKKE